MHNHSTINVIKHIKELSMNRLKIFSISAIALFIAMGCNQAESNPAEPNMSNGINGTDDGSFSAVIDSLTVIGTDSLSADEVSGLLFMREEEKLARDVYAVFGAEYNARVFLTITQSEQRHMDAVKMLIDRYGLTDPVGSRPAGDFADHELQTLYDVLLQSGKQNLADAYAAGATIEEVDIVDLQKRLALTDNDDIAFVYNNLMRGSRNHLRAFVRNLSSQGITYVPKHLSQTEFDDIINSGVERGRGYRQGRN